MDDSFRRDVHVIDVSDGAAPDDTSPADVYVHLAAADAGESDEVRNVALVLHSVRPIRWLLSSAPQLTGSLVILVSGHPAVFHAPSRPHAIATPLSLSLSLSLSILPVSSRLFLVSFSTSVGPRFSSHFLELVSFLPNGTCAEVNPRRAVHIVLFG